MPRRKDASRDDRLPNGRRPPSLFVASLTKHWCTTTFYTDPYLVLIELPGL